MRMQRWQHIVHTLTFENDRGLLVSIDVHFENVYFLPADQIDPAECGYMMAHITFDKCDMESFPLVCASDQTLIINNTAEALCKQDIMIALAWSELPLPHGE